MAVDFNCGNHRELTDEDIQAIHDAFYEKVVPKLQRLDARLGNIDCSFAGTEYSNWIATFRSVGSDFEIVEIAYDPDANTFDLDT